MFWADTVFFKNSGKVEASQSELDTDKNNRKKGQEQGQSIVVFYLEIVKIIKVKKTGIENIDCH